MWSMGRLHGVVQDWRLQVVGWNGNGKSNGKGQYGDSVCDRMTTWGQRLGLVGVGFVDVVDDDDGEGFFFGVKWKPSCLAAAMKARLPIVGAGGRARVHQLAGGDVEVWQVMS